MSKWIQVEILTTTEGIEPVAAVLLDLGLSYSVQDAKDFERFLEGKDSYWDYIDDDLMALKTAPTTMTVYLADQKQGVDQLAKITRELDRLKFIACDEEWGVLTYTLSGVDEEDWATAWKAFYNPVEISPRLAICPQWLTFDPKPQQAVLKIDPGMAFGTGTHESTKMCLEFISENIIGRETVLDVGCGSGILSIAAVLLGAQSAIGSDIDQVAVDTATANAALNGAKEKALFSKGSFAEGIIGTFDFVFANIVANAIMTFADDLGRVLKPDGLFICSGIIDERAEEVRAFLTEKGYTLIGTKEENGWVAYLFKG